eukprot:scaffold3014_cov111-Skeletonema_dohrnii-CCMP3373.AAC.7
MSNTVANTPPSSESRERIDELLDQLLIDTIPPPPLEQHDEPATVAASKNPMDEFANQMNDILSGSKNNSTSSSTNNNSAPINSTDYYQEMKISFEKYELERKQSDQRKEFESIEAFILGEQRRALQQRKDERKVRASEEIKLAAGS